MLGRLLPCALGHKTLGHEKKVLIWKKHWGFGWSQTHWGFPLPDCLLGTWKTGEGCFEFHSPASQGVDGNTKRNCCPMRGQDSDWVTLHWPNSLAWTASGQSEGMLPGSMEGIWREIPFMNDFGVHFCRDHPCPVSKGLEKLHFAAHAVGGNADCSGVRRNRWGSLSSLLLQQPHKMSSPRSETQLEVTQTSPAYFAFSKQRTGHQSKPIICVRACHNK